MLVGIKEAAKAVGISVNELRLGSIAGRYPYLPCGNKRMYDVDELRAAIIQLMHTNQEEARKCLTN